MNIAEFLHEAKLSGARVFLIGEAHAIIHDADFVVELLTEMIKEGRKLVFLMEYFPSEAPSGLLGKDEGITVEVEEYKDTVSSATRLTRLFSQMMELSAPSKVKNVEALLKEPEALRKLLGLPESSELEEVKKKSAKIRRFLSFALENGIEIYGIDLPGGPDIEKQWAKWVQWNCGRDPWMGRQIETILSQDKELTAVCFIGAVHAPKIKYGREDQDGYYGIAGFINTVALCQSDDLAEKGEVKSFEIFPQTFEFNMPRTSAGEKDRASVEYVYDAAKS
ncbi:MAG: hypothetical protein L0332_30485 [Chloroflexi bacterium]|nr:hypothetical protein [Chloroflexota bacterium]MCI0577275.1 hypothetical protein [Chloroflexota bacterium]MCI0649870.1 hypothetical protein [Chloroflexota bacterium]MCI0731028.1 hypothetical protein [Chloroflexota bacterium]